MLENRANQFNNNKKLGKASLKTRVLLQSRVGAGFPGIQPFWINFWLFYMCNQLNHCLYVLLCWSISWQFEEMCAETYGSYSQYGNRWAILNPYQDFLFSRNLDNCIETPQLIHRPTSSRFAGLMDEYILFISSTNSVDLLESFAAKCPKPISFFLLCTSGCSLQEGSNK